MWPACVQMQELGSKVPATSGHPDGGEGRAYHARDSADASSSCSNFQARPS